MTHPALDEMCSGALAWCYLEKGNRFVVPHPPKNPPADRVLNWTAQFDVQGRTQGTWNRGV